MSHHSSNHTSQDSSATQSNNQSENPQVPPADSSSLDEKSLIHDSPLQLDPDELFEAWAQQDYVYTQQKVRRKGVADYPIVLWLILGVASFLTWNSWPAMQALLEKDQFRDCGRVIDRTDIAVKNKSPFIHQERCLLVGFVQHMNSFVIGQQKNATDEDPFKRNQGLSYVAKLAGDNVFAILPAHEPWVESYRVNQGSLVGLQIKNKGLMIQPKLAPTYQSLEKELRKLFYIKLDKDIWFFDLTYSPWDYKMPLVTFILSPLIGLLAIWGLLRHKRRTQDEDSALIEASIEDYESFNA